MKYILLGALSVLGIAGIFSNHERSFPPFFTRKVGKSYGLLVSAITRFEKGSEFYGPVVSLLNINSGTIYGPCIGIVGNESKNGKVLGLEASLGSNMPHSSNDIPSTVRGIQLSLFVNSQKEGRAQIGLFNHTRDKGHFQLGLANYSDSTNQNQSPVQVGVYNSARTIDGKPKRAFLINF